MPLGESAGTVNWSHVENKFDFLVEVAVGAWIWEIILLARADSMQRAHLSLSFSYLRL